jgi:hypothetical protein
MNRRSSREGKPRLAAPPRLGPHRLTANPRLRVCRPGTRAAISRSHDAESEFVRSSFHGSTGGSISGPTGGPPAGPPEQRDVPGPLPATPPFAGFRFCRVFYASTGCTRTSSESDCFSFRDIARVGDRQAPRTYRLRAGSTALSPPPAATRPGRLGGGAMTTRPGGRPAQRSAGARRTRRQDCDANRRPADQLKATMSIESTKPGTELDARLRREQAKAIFDLLASTRSRSPQKRAS